MRMRVSHRAQHAGPERIVSLRVSPAPSAEFHEEMRAGAAVVIEDLPATPETLDWMYVSPAGAFGSYAPGERLGRYRVGGEVAVAPEGGGTISGADYALGFVDLMEKGDQRRAHVNLAY